MKTVLQSLNAALHRAMAADEKVVFIGQDVLDPYGGAFKVAQGLSTAFPDRVLPAPISEAGMVGVAAGMALRGLRPIVEIMFGDFVALIADQVINHAAKYRWMYNDQVRVPLVIRTPMGGRRGYGPTHSQTLEKLFLGVPGLSVLAPSSFGDPGEMLFRAISEAEDPVLFVENKLLYLLPVQDESCANDFEMRRLPGDNWSLSLRSAPPPQVTLAAYGYMAELVRQAAHTLAYEHEIFSELVVCTRLAPFDTQAILDSVSLTGRLLTIEEGWLSLGWGAEVTARVVEACGPRLQTVQRLAALDLPIPAAVPLEKSVLPGVDDIIQAVLRLART
jgi:acetoin:2,6-dichlorophenolindophenol oxidoreductase subunit beta